MNEYATDNNVLAIIFDVGNFREIPLTYEQSQRIVNLKQKRRTYRHAYSGFILSHRVPPRYFKGIILKLLDDKYKDVNHQDYISKAIDIVIKMRSSVKKEENIIPVYNRNGDLLWPKQMDYEEVKKFVEERDKKKTEEKDS